MANKILTNNVFPPIPDRSFDWAAVYENYEPGDAVGTGKTEQEAIDNLKEITGDPYANH